MSQKDGFAGGFLAGAILGGIVGGVVGALVANRVAQKKSGDEPSLEVTEAIRLGTEEEMEIARRNLETKIAQLNYAIDDVRQQLESVPGDYVEKERA